MTDEAEPPSIRVPEGFSVALHSISPTPSIEVLDSGLILVGFGAGSDDPVVLARTIEHTRGLAQRTRGATPLFATSVRRIDDLLGPERPPMAAATRNILWSCSGDALRIFLDDDKFQAALTTDLGSLPSLGLVVDSGWRAGPSVFGELRAAGVAVWEARGGAPFLVEVERPGGVRVHALTVPDAPERPAQPRVDPVWSAPRLRQVLLQAAATSSNVELDQMLAERSIPLVFAVDETGTPMMQNRPDVPGPLLPVFADLQSLHETANQTGLESEHYEVGALRFANLMQWAHSLGVLVAIGFFDDEGAPGYIPFSTEG